MINRRNAIVTLSGALAATAVLATSRSGLAQSVAPQSATGVSIGLSDYKTRTLMIGTFSKQTSELAIARASHPKVKEFGQFEAAEQLTVAQTLTGLDQPPPAPLDPTHTELLRQLQTMSGKAFDLAYLQGQVAGHQALFTVQQDYLNSTPIEADPKHIAMLARTSIQMHLVMLQDLQNTLAA